MRPRVSGTRRYLALWFPLFSTDRLRRLSHRDGAPPDERPHVVVGRLGNALRIVAGDEKAHRLGLAPGLAFADAKARVPEIRVSEHEPQAEAELLESLADWCERYTPLLAVDGADALMLDITGVAHLFGGEDKLLTDLAGRLGAQGFGVRTAIAGTSLGARALSRFGPGGIFAREAQAETCARLPVEALEADPGVTLGLKRAGLTEIGDLAARPRKPLAARFGAEVTGRLAIVLGEADRPIVPRRPLPLFFAEQGFADPIGLSEDITEAIAMLCARLCADLEREAQGGRVFETSFFRADGAVRRIEVLAGQALREPKTLMRLIGMRLDALADPLDPGFGFDAIRIAVLAGDPAHPAQGRLDGSEEMSLALAGLHDRLVARLGPEAVRRFVAQDSHVPERAVASVAVLDDSPSPHPWREPDADLPPSRPFYLIHPPEKIVAIAEVPDGPPRQFRWRRDVFNIIASEGPERISPEWWRARPEARVRDYFRVEDRSGRRFWVFQHGLYEHGPVAWYVHGLFA